MRSITAMLITITLGAGAFAQERFDMKVRNDFFAGFRGDQAALERGMKACEEALKADPRNAYALVWHGSGVYFESNAAFQSGDQQKGMELFQRGVKEMDDAVAIAPDNAGVRIPRGAVLLTSTQYIPNPEITRPLIQKGVGDFERAYDLQKDHFDSLATHDRGELMIGLADGYARLGDADNAKKWFERIRTTLKGTPYEKSANTWLATQTLTPQQAGCLGCHVGN